MTRPDPRPLLLLAAGLGACDDSKGDTGWSDLPNLRISGFYVEKTGGDYRYTALVENDGAVAADSFSVDLWIDRGSEPRSGQNGDESEKIGMGLGAGDVTEVTFTVGGSRVNVGDTSWVLADSLGQVDEAYEDDNSAGPSEVVER